MADTISPSDSSVDSDGGVVVDDIGASEEEASNECPPGVDDNSAGAAEMISSTLTAECCFEVPSALSSWLTTSSSCRSITTSPRMFTSSEGPSPLPDWFFSSALESSSKKKKREAKALLLPTLASKE